MRLMHYLLLMTLCSLTACNLQSTKQPSRDLANVIEVEKTASDAYQKGDWKTAEQAYKTLTQQVPGQSEPWFRLGNIYARTERLDAAVYAYRQALTRDSKNSKIWHNLGVVQLRLATNTFVTMLQHTRESDPLSTRAKHVIDSVTELMASGFEAPDRQ